jgi:hypothetical protein
MLQIEHSEWNHGTHGTFKRRCITTRPVPSFCLFTLYMQFSSRNVDKIRDKIVGIDLWGATRAGSVMSGSIAWFELKSFTPYLK